MATNQSTVDYIVEQIAGAGAVAGRKMFGEYALFCDGKMVALICDDQLYIKPTVAGRSHLSVVIEKPPYKGAKPYFWISGDRWDDSDWLTELVRLSAAELP
ncbi:MAG TPA: TfoX/Sxy family protein, partial [Geobacterales bacterium]|nr:TfoX/Sxy family protein [Geobacterales bacterium]